MQFIEFKKNYISFRVYFTLSCRIVVMINRLILEP